jgi:hypothetical protein
MTLWDGAIDTIDRDREMGGIFHERRNHPVHPAPETWSRANRFSDHRVSLPVRPDDPALDHADTARGSENCTHKNTMDSLIGTQ